VQVEVFVPCWAAPANVRTLQTTRRGGVSRGPWASLNLGDHVGDEPGAVAANRAAVRCLLPAEPAWLRQVHGTVAVDAAPGGKMPEADAAWTRRPDRVCVVMTADCLPVLFCDRAGSVVAAAHAGWRGLLAGVLESTVAAMGVAPAELLAWLGPAIGPHRFEVGDEVRAAFAARDTHAGACFRPGARPGKWLCDLPALARQRLAACGVRDVTGSDECTVDQPDRYFSFRRDGTTGRMATMIWLEARDAGV
jgi:YfiH family protein